MRELIHLQVKLKVSLISFFIQIIIHYVHSRMFAPSIFICLVRSLVWLSSRVSCFSDNYTRHHCSHPWKQQQQPKSKQWKEREMKWRSWNNIWLGRLAWKCWMKKWKADFLFQTFSAICWLRIDVCLLFVSFSLIFIRLQTGNILHVCQSPSYLVRSVICVIYKLDYKFRKILERLNSDFRKIPINLKWRCSQVLFIRKHYFDITCLSSLDIKGYRESLCDGNCETLISPSTRC